MKRVGGRSSVTAEGKQNHTGFKAPSPSVIPEDITLVRLFVDIVIVNLILDPHSADLVSLKKRKRKD